jgi:hypothetical protein
MKHEALIGVKSRHEIIVDGKIHASGKIQRTATRAGTSYLISSKIQRKASIVLKNMLMYRTLEDVSMTRAEHVRVHSGVRIIIVSGA